MESEESNVQVDNKAKLDYLKELLTDRAILSNYPGIYLHVGKILEKEILKVRSALFATYGIYSISESDLPEPEGPKVNLVTRVYMPNGENSSFNFVGRILGPDGSTAKCLQQCLGVKLMVRGRGSMRDRKKEEANIGKPNWEHLSDKLHIVLTVEDYENRAQARLAKASEYISLFLKESMKASDREDKVKQMQLMELSFRREPRASWPVGYNGLFNFGLPAKAGAMFPNPNSVGFGHGYPPPGPPHPPMFSPMHRYPQHHHPFGPISGQQPGAHGPLGNLTHSFTPALSPVLVGHGPTVPHMTSSTSVAGPTHPGPAALPGALAMASVNYWHGTAPGVAHISSPEYIPSHNHHHHNGYTQSVGPEQGTAADGFSSNGSQAGVCNVFLTSSSAALAQPALSQHHSAAGQAGQFARGHEEPGLLTDFGSSAAAKDQNSGASESRTPTSVHNSLSGLYSPSTTVASATNSLKSSTATLSGPSPPPPSSFAAKQGLKSRYFQKSNNAAFPSSTAGQSSRAARNTVVAVKVGSSDKSGELINGSRRSAALDQPKNETTLGSGGKADGVASKPDKKLAAKPKQKSSEYEWHKVEAHKPNKRANRHSTSDNSSSLERIDQRMLDLSLISNASTTDLAADSASSDSTK